MTAFLKRSLLFGLMTGVLTAHVQCEWPTCPNWFVEQGMQADALHTLVAVFILGAWFGSALTSFRR